MRKKHWRKILLAPVAIFVAFGFSSGQLMAQATGVTSNVLLRVKRLVVGPASGTAFTMEVDGRQYIVTAKHMVATLTGENSTVQLCDDQTKCTEIKVKVLRCDDPIDIAVLVPPHKVSVTFALEPSSKGMIVGQDMYFVGFPYADYALTTNTGAEAIGFVRKATFSAQEHRNGYTRIYLDGRNNPGFSGSPVVYVEPGKPATEFKVAGVVSGYRIDFSDVKKLEPIESDKITPEDRALNRILDLPDGTHRKLVGTDLIVPGNSGIVVAYAIDHAVDLVRKSGAEGPDAK